MEGKGCFVFFVSFVTLFSFDINIDFVRASLLTTEKSVTEETYSDTYVKTPEMSEAILDTSLRKRRYMQEQGRRPADVCAGIIGPNWHNNTKTKNGPCSTLFVTVPKKTGFTEFVEVNEQNEVKGGFSIAVFCYALHLLPFEVRPIFEPFVNEQGKSDGSYDELLRHIEGKTCEAVAGDVTIRGNRAQYVDFTAPYMSSEIYMLVRGVHQWNQTLFTFLRPFTWRLWLTIIGACIFIGIALAILEYRAHNPKFVTPFYQNIAMVVWFPISTFFFHEGKIFNRCSKVVLVMWLCMIFIVLQIFTACLSSLLTIDQLRPKLPTSFDRIGYQDGSFLQNFIMQKHNCTQNQLLKLNGVDEYKNALDNSTVNVIYDELPYIDIFLATYGSEYMKFGPINMEPGIAFAFPLNSPIFQTFSKAVINVTESKIMMELKKRYLGFYIPNQSHNYNQAIPQSLDVPSFAALFIFMGSVTIVALILSEIFLRKEIKVLPLHQPVTSV